MYKHKIFPKKKSEAFQLNSVHHKARIFHTKNSEAESYAKVLKYNKSQMIKMSHLINMNLFTKIYRLN